MIRTDREHGADPACAALAYEPPTGRGDGPTLKMRRWRRPINAVDPAELEPRRQR